MNWWKELITDNPMQVDMRRFARKFFSPSRINVASATVLVLAALGYLLIVLVALAFSEGLDPSVFLYIQTFLYCIVVPAALHGAIAGEREKRTWDLLLVAPVTKPQIVVGKFLTGVAVVLAVAVLMLVPCILTIPKSEGFRVGAFFHMELISVLFGIALSAMCLFFSARARRAFAAQGTIYGVLVLTLILWPIFVSILTAPGFNRVTSDVLLAPHPFVAMARVYDSARRDAWDTSIGFDLLYLGWFHIFAYGVTTVFFLVYAVKTVHFAENDVKFINRKKEVPSA